MISYKKSLFWFRRDLRLHDNNGLTQALHQSEKVVPFFLFDSSILDKLPATDPRVTFIFDSIAWLKEDLQKKGSDLYVTHGRAEELLLNVCQKHKIEAVFTNRDYEPYAKLRDSNVQKMLKTKGIDFLSFKDQVIFDQNEVLTKGETPFKIFTAYKNEWYRQKDKGNPFFEKKNNFAHLIDQKELKEWPKQTLTSLGFCEKRQIPLNLTGEKGANKSLNLFLPKLENYTKDRDYPFLDATSHLSPHLRFGTISLRKIFRLLEKSELDRNKTFQNELIWREFFFMILDHFPYVEKEAFKPKYQKSKYQKNDQYFMKWTQGQTGFPLVDAAMNQLNETGWMHNRLRMLVANFFCKLLQLDWRLGEAYFAEKLIDFDLAANNGGWQWSASTGVDACPSFRIFNPTLQQKKFDPEMAFIKKWGNPSFPPIINYEKSRHSYLYSSPFTC